MYVVLLTYWVIVKILMPLPLKGLLVISHRRSFPCLAIEATLDYHVIGCVRSIVMFTYIILTNPGTHEYSESKSNKVKNYRTGSCPGLEFHHPKMEKGTPIKSRHGFGTPPPVNEK